METSVLFAKSEGREEKWKRKDVEKDCFRKHGGARWDVARQMHGCYSRAWIGRNNYGYWRIERRGEGRGGEVSRRRHYSRLAHSRVHVCSGTVVRNHRNWKRLENIVAELVAFTAATRGKDFKDRAAFAEFPSTPSTTRRTRIVLAWKRRDFSGSSFGNDRSRLRYGTVVQRRLPRNRLFLSVCIAPSREP